MFDQHPAVHAISSSHVYVGLNGNEQRTVNAVELYLPVYDRDQTRRTVRLLILARQTVRGLRSRPPRAR